MARFPPTPEQEPGAAVAQGCCAVDDPWGIQSVMAQGRDEGLGAPVSKGGVIDETLPARSPARSFGHIGLDRGFIEESQSLQVIGHEWLALRDPDAAQPGHNLALLLKRLKVFFVTEAKATQNPPDCAAVDVDAMGLGQLSHKFVKRNLALGGDARFDPAGNARQLAVAAAIALGTGFQRSGLSAQLDQIVHDLGRHPEVPPGLSMLVTLINERNHALAQIYWTWLAHL